MRAVQIGLSQGQFGLLEESPNLSVGSPFLLVERMLDLVQPFFCGINLVHDLAAAFEVRAFAGSGELADGRNIGRDAICKLLRRGLLLRCGLLFRSRRDGHVAGSDVAHLPFRLRRGLRRGQHRRGNVRQLRQRHEGERSIAGDLGKRQSRGLSGRRQRRVRPVSATRQKSGEQNDSRRFYCGIHSPIPLKDDSSLMSGRPRSPGSGGGIEGIRSVKVVPFPSFDSTSRWPWCSCTIRYVMARPMPLPSRFVVKYRSKIRSRISGGMPSPWSSILRIADRGSSVSRTESSPPWDMACAPLITTLSRACLMRSASIRTFMGWSGTSLSTVILRGSISAEASMSTLETIGRRS